MSSTIHRVSRSCVLGVLAAIAGAALFASAGAEARPSERTLLARAYEHGEGVKRDVERAADLYCEAAREGDADAAYALAWMLAHGRGVTRDDAGAVALFGLAAQAGHAQSHAMLALLRSTSPKPPDCLRPPVPPLAWGPPEPPIVVVLAPPPEPPSADPGPEPFANLPRWKQQIADLVGKLAPRFGVDPKLALSVIAVESNFDARARSPKDARGLMQLIPETAERFNVKDAYDPRQNVQGGLAYLRFLLAYYRGDVVLAAAAYNAGEKAVDRHGGIPPYAETQTYVRRILALYRSDRHPFDPRHAPSVSALVERLGL